MLYQDILEKDWYDNLMKKLLVIIFLFFSLSANSSGHVFPKYDYGDIGWVLAYYGDDEFTTGFAIGAIEGAVQQERSAQAMNNSNKHFCITIDENYSVENLFQEIYDFYWKNESNIPDDTPYAIFVSLALNKKYPC